jgi:hypothetical protein
MNGFLKNKNLKWCSTVWEFVQNIFIYIHHNLGASPLLLLQRTEIISAA